MFRSKHNSRKLETVNRDILRTKITKRKPVRFVVIVIIYLCLSDPRCFFSLEIGSTKPIISRHITCFFLCFGYVDQPLMLREVMYIYKMYAEFVING